MAEINNYSDISENFDTIKTLLNSIRAQGILNTSDVDKLLAGINTKLEKINTEEDIELIKVFLSDLKQNLDERHNVLVSKFGAIESLFSNLLKNSADTLKSGEVKELFDIVATNLSVFSREVVSQKETLTDITLRLDSMRSDDTNKKEIIKNISVLKTDIEHISNGFDSIVLSLNENFKTVLKSISEFDKTDSINEFGTQLNHIADNTSSIMSAIQLIDKKNNQFEDAFNGLAKQSDVSGVQRGLVELTEKSRELSDLIDMLTQKSYKIDNLSDKIDASVNILAGLKSEISDRGDVNKRAIIDRLDLLEETVRAVSTEAEYESVKLAISSLSEEISSNGSNLNSKIQSICEDIKEKVNAESDKITQLVDVNITRTISDISNNAEVLNSRIKDTHSAIAELCERNFNEVSENISSLKTVVAQLDENNVSANNAIFSNITDRLTLFESSLKSSLEKQEHYVSNSSDQVLEQVSDIKNLSQNVDYKLDSTVIELTNSKREFEDLKNSVNDLLALDFVNTVKDLKVDLYASKQDLSNSLESIQGDLSEKFTSDLFGKYELLINKLDNVEDEIKSVQTESLNNMKSVIENILSSLVDIRSYVSASGNLSTESLDCKIQEFTKVISDSNLNYLENIKNIIDVINDQVENNLQQINEESENKMNRVAAAIKDSNDGVKEEIKNSYNKLLEVQSNFEDIKETLNLNSITMKTNIDKVIDSAEGLKSDFDSRLNTLKNSLLDKISDFKKEFTFDNADKYSELKFNTENYYTKAVQQAIDLTTEVKDELGNKIAEVSNGFTNLETAVSNLTSETSSSLTSTLGTLLDNFVSLRAMVNNLEDNTVDNLRQHITTVRKDFAELKERFNEVDSAIDEDLTKQMSIIERNFESINAVISEILEKTNDSLGDKIKEELNGASDKMSEALSAQLENYKSQIETLFGEFKGQNSVQSEFIKEKVLELNNVLENTLDKQQRDSILQLNEISNRLNDILTDNLKVSSADYASLKDKFRDFTVELEKKNNDLVDGIKAQLDDITRFVDTTLELQAQDVNAGFDSINSNMQKVNAYMEDYKGQLNEKAVSLENLLNTIKNEAKGNSDEKSTLIINTLSSIVKDLSESSTENLETKICDVISLIENSSSLSQNIVKEKSKDILDELIVIQASVLEYYNGVRSALSTEIKPELSGISDKIQSLFEEHTVNFVSQLGNTNNQISEELRANAIELKASFEALNERLDKDELSQMNVYQAQVKELSSTFNELIEESKELTKSEISAISASLIKNSKDIFEELDLSIEEKINTLLSTSADITAGELQTIESFANKILDQVASVKQNSILCKDLIINLLKEQFEIVSTDIEKETDVIVGDLLEQMSILKDSQKDELSILSSTLEGSIAGYVIDAVNDMKSYLDVKTDTSILNSKLDSLKSELERSVEDTANNMSKLVELDTFNDSIGDLRAANEVLASSLTEKLNKQIQEFFDNKFVLFDKKFTDTVVDKYEELKLTTKDYDNVFKKISNSVEELLGDFSKSKDEITSEVSKLIERLQGSVDDLKISFADLKSQILNKSFDEAFHESVHNQISGIENLVHEQMGYLEDISELCCNNLPELAEMNTIVKFGIQESISKLQEKIDNQDANINDEIKALKSDVITQFLNIFNQISFVAEQDEIIDFIQEKHSELITILSHIVTTSDGVETVKDNLAVVDNKMDSLKEDIDLINEKLTSIMSSDGDVDYVYSLHDLESDIANLRLVLNQLKEQMPTFEAEQFKKDFEALSEDIVSISSRTNKLILSSDESQKVLQDNLQDFKLVINDLDERTRNFAHESGMDRIDSKLGALNTMVQNGAKTNQVFNQIFEYLAEWVDKAGAQISSISDKVETLDELGQVKVMLEDLRAESHDNSESNELVEALTAVFDKQAKRISSLEAKLDRMIVDNTINNKNNKIDLLPIEDTLNRFLVAIDDKMISQENKIKSLEEKLDEYASLAGNKDTAQLTKKVGGMDRQLAKLNKSIEKIASNVVEK